MKLLIIGGGAVASVMAKILAKDSATELIVCGTNDLPKARRFLLGISPKIRLALLDAGNTDSVVRAAIGMDIIVNASLPRLNLGVMRAAREAGCGYLDLDSRLLDWRHAEQLREDGRFRREGLPALINAGISPGVTNLLAGEAASKLDSVRAVRFRLLEDQDADRFIPTWSTKVLLDELRADPLIFRRGRFAFIKPLRAREMHDFGPGIGPRPIYTVFGDEIATVPLLLDVKEANYKAGGSDIEHAVVLGSKRKLARFLKEAVVPSPKEMGVLVRDGVIRDARLVITVEVEGRKDGAAATIRYQVVCPDLKTILRLAPGSTYISYPTAAAAVAFIKAMPGSKRTGVFPAEALDAASRRRVLKELKRLGIRIRRVV